MAASMQNRENVKPLDANGNETDSPLKIADSKADKKNDGDNKRRLEYLLKQTEVFTHFMSNGRINVQDKRKSVSGKTPSAKRNRKKKYEEDEIEGSHDAPEAYCFTENPPFIEGEMRDYQIRGLNWLISLYENNINGILADEMGLGKTLQSISIIGYLYHFKKHYGPYLVVVPKSTLYNWVAEFKRWCPTIRTLPFFGSKEERNDLKNELYAKNKWDVCITTYEMCLKDKTALKKLNWRYMIVDEAHRIKNEKTLLAQALRSLSTRNRLLLTGTPLQNNLHELWALLNFLLPDVFDSADDFDEWFDSDECLGDDSLVQRLQQILKPFMLRRIKADVEKQLLPKKETKIFIGLAKLQREWYKKVLLRDIDKVINGTQITKMSLQYLLMHLRKCANHPYLFEGAEPGPPYTTDEHLVNNSGKMIAMDKLLKKLKEQGHRVLLFTQMSRMLDIFEDYCFLRQYEYCRLDGQTSFEDRAEAVEQFNAENSSKFIFMLTTRAGGLGLNLMTADTVIIFDSDWNPQADIQAMDRAHRIGQTKQVRVFRLITENTVDQKIVERAEVKLRLDKIVIQNGKGIIENNQMTKDEMQKIVKFGANYILSSDQTDVIDENIDQILERAEKKTAVQNEELNKLGENQLRAFTFDVPATLSEASAYSVYQFEGTNYKSLHKNVDPLTITLPKRVRKAVHYNYDQLINQNRQQQKQPSKLKPAYQDFHFLPKRYYELEEEDNFYDEDGNKITPLNKKDLIEMKKLESQGFTNWSQTSFQNYINALVRFGRSDIKNVSQRVPGKRPDEVIAYHQVFCKRYTELNNYDAIMKRIQRGEDLLKKKNELKIALNWKVSNYGAPFEELTLKQFVIGNKNFNMSHNRFIICMMQKLGLENASLYHEIQAAFRSSPRFLFDFFIKTLTVIEIEKQASYLLKAIHGEYLKHKSEQMEKMKSVNFNPNHSVNVGASGSGIAHKPLQVISNGTNVIPRPTIMALNGSNISSDQLQAIPSESGVLNSSGIFHAPQSSESSGSGIFHVSNINQNTSISKSAQVQNYSGSIFDTPVNRSTKRKNESHDSDVEFVVDTEDSDSDDTELSDDETERSIHSAKKNKLF